MRAKTFITNGAKSLFSGLVLAGTVISAVAGDLNINNDAVTVTSGGGFNSGALTITPTTGIIPSVTLPVAAVSGVSAVPNFSFTMEGTNVTDGIYTFSAGFIIDDDNSARRLEISIPSISMNFSGAGTILSGSVPAGSSVTVLGRAADNTTELSATLANNLLTFSGNSLSFTAGNQVTEIQGKGGILGDIVNTINANGAFSYAVVLKQTSGAEALNFGTEIGGFAALGCAPSNAFVLVGGQLASTYSGGFGLQGQFRIVAGAYGAAPTPFASACTPITSGGGGGGGSSADGQVSASLIETNDFINTLSTTEITATTVTNFTTIVNNTTTTTTNAIAAITAGTAGASTGLNLFTALNSQLLATKTIIDGGQTIPGSTINAVMNNTQSLIRALRGASLTAGQVSQVRTLITSSMQSLANIFKSLKGTNNLITQDSLIAVDAITSSTAIADISSIIQSAADAVNESLPIIGSQVESALFSEVQTVSQDALELLLKPLGALLGLNLTYSSEAATQTLLSANSKLLEMVLDNIAIDLGAGQSVVNTAALQTALVSVGISSDSATAISNQIGSFIKADSLAVDNGTGLMNVSTILTSALSASSLTIDSITGNVSYTVSGQSYSALVKSVNPVPTSIPSGQFTLDDGSKVVVSNGLAFTLVSSGKDLVALAGAVKTTGGSLFSTAFSNDGLIVITEIASNVVFNAAFSSSALSTGTSSGSVTFETPSGDPASSSYQFVVQFADGTRQSISPAIADNAFYDSVAKAGFGVTTDRSTGIIQINGFRFRPDYAQKPVTQTESVYRSFNADSSGVAYQSVQANGDGITDYKVITGTGTQIVYGLP